MRIRTPLSIGHWIRIGRGGLSGVARGGRAGGAAGLSKGISKQVFNLRVQAAKIVVRPALDPLEHPDVDPKQK
jgi:hypothetical protein